MPLMIVLPTQDARFNIDTIPRMPNIACQARITGVQPDPTATTLFNWSIQITETVQLGSCPSTRIRNCNITTGWC